MATTLLQRLIFGSPYRAPPTPELHKPTAAADVGLLDPAAIETYRNVAHQIGVSSQGLDLEEFRLFLNKHDLPTFNRAEVVSYMDRIAERTNPTGFGWQWCPVRQSDAKIGATFGTPCVQHQDTVRDQRAGTVHTSISRATPASDYYSDRTPAYVRVMPLHALQKIALIEDKFGKDRVRFLVTDYVLIPHEIIRSETVIPRPSPPPRVYPDPFLMAVIPSRDAIYGVGCYIIDVWDEPGFGLVQRLK